MAFITTAEGLRDPLRSWPTDEVARTGGHVQREPEAHPGSTDAKHGARHEGDRSGDGLEEEQAGRLKDEIIAVSNRSPLDYVNVSGDER